MSRPHTHKRARTLARKQRRREEHKVRSGTRAPFRKLGDGRLFGAEVCEHLLPDMLAAVRLASADWLTCRLPDGALYLLTDAWLCPGPPRCLTDHDTVARNVLAAIAADVRSGRLGPGSLEASPGWRESPPLPLLKELLR